MKLSITPHSFPWELLILDPLDIIMFQKVYYCLMKEAMIGYHLLPTKYQNCTPISTIKQAILQKYLVSQEKTNLTYKLKKTPIHG